MKINELKLFENEKLSFSYKFYILMHILVSNQDLNEFENILYFIINSIQILSIYFSKYLGTFDPDDNVSDEILFIIQKIGRLGDLLINDYNYFKISIYIILLILMLGTIFFFYVLLNIKKKSLYTMEFMILNIYIKVFKNIIFNITLDIFSMQLCFGSEYNKYLEEIKCNNSNNKIPFIISLFNYIYSIIMIFFINFFCLDSFYISPNKNSHISCYFEHLFSIMQIIQSFTYKLYKEFYKGNFYLINLTYSIFLFYYILQNFVYYNQFVLLLKSLVILLIIWTNVFSFVFSYLELTEKGLIIILSYFIISYIYCKVYNNLINKLLFEIPYHKISNKNYLMIYIKIIYDKITHLEGNVENKNLLIGIIQMHAIECPNEKCLVKTNNKIYLPKDEEWSDRKKPFIYDKVFLNNFIVVILNYFIALNFYTPEMIINLSLYYLNEIGNICKALYYYRKSKDMKLSIQEKFSLMRLKFMIQQKLVEKFNKKNESCYNLEELNPTFYFEYYDLVDKFINEIYNDLDLSLDFWKTFSSENKKIINFNKVFKNVDLILKSKNKVKFYWNKLFNIYSGINKYYDFYLDYVGVINDNNVLHRELENYKQKKENSAENIQKNYYNILFNQETGIVICNGENGKEGIIVKCNSEFGKIFKYDHEKMNGMNISELMPKNLKKHHSKFMRNYFEIGEKKIINLKEYKTFALDRYNHLLVIKKSIKIFPLLNNNLNYIGMIYPEKIDDMIFVDNNFNIQGMSTKLSDVLQLYNNNIFQDYEIPFYVICKQFLNFYKIFLKGNKKNLTIKTVQTLNHSVNNESSESYEEIEKEEMERTLTNENVIDNIEINENIELEYEIKIPAFFEKLKNQDNNEQYVNKEDEILEEESELLNPSVNLEKKEFLNLKTSVTPSENNLNFEKFTVKKTHHSPINTGNAISLIPLNSNDKNNKINNAENDAIKRLNLYKLYFKTEKFNEIEHLFDKDTHGENIVDLFFNFTFEKYIFSGNKVGYIIRCIDNKNDFGSYENIIENMENINIKNENNFSKIIIDKLKIFKKQNQVYEEELKEFYDNIKELYHILKIDDKFLQLIKENLDFTKNSSRILGKKYGIVEEDENSSQSSTAGYDNDLSKLSRIQEIKENLLKTVVISKAIIYIKLIGLVIFFSTIIFSIIFILYLHYIKTILYSLGEFNEKIYSTFSLGLEISNNVLNVFYIYYFKKKDLNFSFMNQYGTQEEYFQRLKIDGHILYTKYINNMGYLLQNINKYNFNTKNIWTKLNINYYYNVSFSDREFLLIIIMQSLYNSFSIFKHKDFDINHILNSVDQSSIDLLNEFDYDKYSVVENFRNNILGYLIDKLPNFNDSYKSQHNYYINVLIYIIMIYFIVVTLFYLLYTIILIQNSNKMNEGFEKVLKISQDKVDEMIKRIKNFKNFYIKKFSKTKYNEFKTIQTTINNNENFNNNNNNNNNNLLFESNDKLSNNNSLTMHNSNGNLDFGFEGKKTIPLKLTSKIIFQYLYVFTLLFCILIMLFIYTRLFIKNDYNLIISENYLIKNILYFILNMYELKLDLTYSLKIAKINIENITNSSDSVTFYETLGKFKKFSDYYYSKYSTDCCAALHDINSEEYNNCFNFFLSGYINNTEAFLDFGNRLVNNLYYEFTEKNATEEYYGFKLLNSVNYYNLEITFKNYTIHVIDRIIQYARSAYNDSAHEIFALVIELNIVLNVLLFVYFLYISCIFLKILERNLFTSRSFILIIPSVYISNTQDLESWLEKIDNSKK